MRRRSMVSNNTVHHQIILNPSITVFEFQYFESTSTVSEALNNVQINFNLFYHYGEVGVLGDMITVTFILTLKTFKKVLIYIPL